VRRVHALLSAALHQAERWDLVDKNVARRATPPKVQVAQIEVPTPDEIRAIAQSVGVSRQTIYRYLECVSP
jgi:ACT domain-containing protein